MHPIKPEFDLLKLVRGLEEILAMVNADHTGTIGQCVKEVAVMPVNHKEDAIAAEPGSLFDRDKACGHPEKVQRNERDGLYDDALVVITEFGQASPVMLQMWLSIDYRRATNIFNQFQADGLVSSKGRVRHKAYLLRRSEQEVTDARNARAT
jgi:DNA segregation ATPase FtsK/SpoIIIE-like protein